MAHSPASAEQAAATLADLLARGAARREPVRFHFARALARRSAAQTGAVRQQLDARLARVLADLQQRLDTHPHPTPAVSDTPPAPGRGLLGLMLVQAGSAASTAGPASGPGTPGAAPPAELRAVRDFGATWARLRLDQQLQRAQDQQPGNAGPLNSHRLVLQALQQLRQLSPAYLQRFMAHAEALLWLERAAVEPPARRPGRGAEQAALTPPAAGRPAAAPASPAARPPGSRAAPSRAPRSRAAPR